MAVFVLAAVLLFYRVEYRTFWMDETMALNYLSNSPMEFLRTYWHHPDNHPPLYYFLVLLASKILPWTEFTIRLVSMLSGIGMVFLVYRMTLFIGQSKQSANLAAFFTAFSSYFMLISQMARYHSLAGFTALLTVYFFCEVYTDGFTTRRLHRYMAGLIFVGYVDYPHFIYVVLMTNALYVYRFCRGRPITGIGRWMAGQGVVALACSPVAWLVYQRVFIQGDGGWNNINLLANSWLHLAAGAVFHIYAFFFGENIFPWNPAFALGCIVLLAAAVGLTRAIWQKKLSEGERLVACMGFGFILFNTLFMNKADPRYNFIVYPKFGFVAYPLFIMTVALGLASLRSKKLQRIFFVMWLVVASIGLFYFYNARNYINPSYFRTFASFAYVRDHAENGDRLAITPDASDGLYYFYKQTYFRHLTMLPHDKIETAPAGTRVWFFSTGSDGPEATVTPESRVPAGYKILDQFDTTPLDPKFRFYKEKILHRPSYMYKYSLFLLQKV